MVKIQGIFPQGRKKALTLSYDDGVMQDKRLVEIFNKYGLKATFNLNSGIQSEENQWINNGIIIKRINKADILDLYAGHEVAIHSLTHPHLEAMTKEEVKREIFEDKRNLETTFGYIVRGMAYPYGTYNETVLEVLNELGVEYSRTVRQTENFQLPEKPLEWEPTCHHKNPKLMEIAEDFLKSDRNELSLLYVWGHSYEFDVDGNWELIEQFGRLVSNKNEIWYASNIDIIDYLNALKNLRLSAEVSMAYNPSAVSVWISANNIVQEIKAGETKFLK